jgi:hypothetical protein
LGESAWKAFRRAISHPELHPGDPDTAKWPREIIAAGEPYPISPQFHTNSNGLGSRYNAEQCLIGQRILFLHDGRTSDFLQAIQAHFSTSFLVEADLSSTLNLGRACVATNNGYVASAANQVMQNFSALSVSDKQVSPRPPAVTAMFIRSWSMKRSKRATSWWP